MFAPRITNQRLEDRIFERFTEGERQHTNELIAMEARLTKRLDSIVGESNGHTPDPDSLAGLSRRVEHIESSLTYIKATCLLLLPICAIVVTALGLALR